MPRCHVCGAYVDMPYRCTYCERVHCETHRLPESHDCVGAHKAAAASRERRRSGHPGVEVQGSQRRQSAGGPMGPGGSGGLWDRVEGKVAMYLLGAIVGVFVLEMIVLQTFGQAAFETLFVLDSSWYLKPWTLITSIFAHGGFSHLLFNGIVLFFFGPLLERRVGSRRFLYIVLAGGVIAGLAQVTFFSTFLQTEQGVVGISGALMAIMGVLTVLGPRITVLIFFIVPAPLWALTLGYAALDTFGLFFQTGNIAHMAHLAGLVLGLYWGKLLRDQGYAFPGRTGQIQGGFQRRSGW